MTTNITRRRALALLLSLLAGAVQGTAGASDRATPSEVSSETPEEDEGQRALVALVDGNNRFALELYARLGAVGQGNLVYSPYSLSSALAMVYAGARGDTEAELTRVLHFAQPQAELHRAMAELARQLATDAQAGAAVDAAAPTHPMLRIANRLWCQRGEGFLEPFLALTRERYRAELAQLDFRRPSARDAINAWVAEQTAGRIRELVGEPLDPSSRLVLTNALYLDAAWQIPFDKHATGRGGFYTGNEQLTVPMMHQTSHYAYGGRKELQILELPYAGSDLSMLVLLPPRGGVRQLERQLSVENLNKWSQALDWVEVQVALPRFAFESSFDAKETLRALGLAHAMSSVPGEADFSGINGDRDLFLSKVLHKARIEVNERGTEAAAATAVEVCTGAAPGPKPEPVVFRADRPFLFLIRDNQTGAILFMGRVSTPET